MTTEAIERSLLEVDGSCRDINFSEYIPTAGAAALLEFIGARWELTQATDAEGVALQAKDFEAFLTQEKGALSTRWEGPLDPRHLQACFYWAQPDRIFCELTFFPQDLDAQRFALDGFLELLAALVNAAHSGEYYVRIEDASWSHGDKSAKQSVIFSHESLVLPLPLMC